MKDLIIPARVEYRDQPVLVTEQLAKFYECDPRQIKQNFNNNKDRFVEGVHYFKLEGDALKEFKNMVENLDLVGKNANVLYLWTKQGAFHHAKMLSTDKAWKVYELLEENYFNPKPAAAPPVAETQNPDEKNLPPYLTDPIKFCVYTHLMSNNTVKIGKSKDFLRRAGEIKRINHLDILDSYRTGYLPALIASEIEKICLRMFDFYRIQGEFFSANFADVRAKLNETARMVIETHRMIYGKKWSDANAEYDKFLLEIPLLPNTKTIEVAPASAELAAATSEFSPREKAEYLLECARLAPTDELKIHFLQRIATII